MDVLCEDNLLYVAISYYRQSPHICVLWRLFLKNKFIVQANFVLNIVVLVEVVINSDPSFK